MPDTETETETEQVIVVGMNRTRLLKIMTMVTEEGSAEKDDKSVEYVPCVAAMSSYEGGDGEYIRYMSSFVFHDGSPMNKFFDDEEFRTNLKKIIMVGYEWKESDQDLLEKYFEAFLLPVAIECVGPNEGFLSLSEEMQHYKNLTTEEKEEHSSNRTMGPRKMTRFILDALRSSKPIGQNETTIRATELENYDAPCLEDEENKAGAVKTQTPEKEEEPPQQRTPKAIDYTVTSFACRMCRTVLLSENHLAEDHIQNQHSFKIRKYQGMNGGSRCQSLFCDESVLEWLAPRDTEYDSEGKLICPKCSFKVGHWNWSGAQCSCGTWVVPAIQIPLGKIDIILPLSERQKAVPMIVVTPKTF